MIFPNRILRAPPVETGCASMTGEQRYIVKASQTSGLGIICCRKCGHQVEPDCAEMRDDIASTTSRGLTTRLISFPLFVVVFLAIEPSQRENDRNGEGDSDCPGEKAVMAYPTFASGKHHNQKDRLSTSRKAVNEENRSEDTQ
jgi:hypothetical protein